MELGEGLTLTSLSSTTVLCCSLLPVCVRSLPIVPNLFLLLTKETQEWLEESESDEEEEDMEGAEGGEEDEESSEEDSEDEGGKKKDVFFILT